MGMKGLVTIPLFVALFFLSSCSEPARVLPYESDEAEKRAAEIRRNGIAPDSWVLQALENADTVNLVDSPGYGMGLDVIKYLLPLLHSRGITELDLWFIPEEGYAQANALLRASRFFTDSAADLCGRIGFLTLYEEQIDFLRYLYNFNHNLDAGEEGIMLTSLPSEGGKGLIYSLEPREEMPLLYIQSPTRMKALEAEGESDLKDRLDQLIPLLRGKAPFFVADEDHFLWEKGDRIPLLVLAEPGKIGTCTPLDGGINKANYETALEDFPDQVLRKPPFLAVLFMERAQRHFLKTLP